MDVVQKIIIGDLQKTKVIVDVNIVVAVTNAVRNEELALRTIPLGLRNVKSLFRKTVRAVPKIVTELDDELSNDRQFIISLVKINASCFRYLQDKCKTDAEIAEWAINANAEMFQYASEKLRGDREFCIKILNGGCYGKIVPFMLIDLGKEFFLKYSYLIEHAQPQILNDVEFMKKIIEIDRSAFAFAGTNVRSNKEIIEFILEKKTSLIVYVPTEMWHQFTKYF